MFDDAAQVIGDLGAQLVLTVRENTVCGPIVATLRPQGQRTAVDLTGASVVGGIRRRAADRDYLLPFSIEVLQPETRGQFRFALSVDEVDTVIAAFNPRRDPAVRAYFDLRVVDSLGDARPLVYGEVHVALGAADLTVPLVAGRGCRAGVFRQSKAGIVLQLSAVQGMAGPPGEAGQDAFPIAPDCDIEPGATEPIAPYGSFAYSTVALGLVRFDGVHWVALGGGSVPPETPTYPTGALLNGLGAVLVNDLGEVVTSG